MIPSTTTGVTWSCPAPGTVNDHFGARRATVFLSICVSVVYRLPPGSPL
jgi:hypothetical protein